MGAARPFGYGRPRNAPAITRGGRLSPLAQFPLALQFSFVTTAALLNLGGSFAVSTPALFELCCTAGFCAPAFLALGRTSGLLRAAVEIVTCGGLRCRGSATLLGLRLVDGKSQGAPNLPKGFIELLVRLIGTRRPTGSIRPRSRPCLVSRRLRAFTPAERSREKIEDDERDPKETFEIHTIC